MIQLGQHVRLLFRNGAMAEGIVEIWSDKNIQLQSIYDDSTMLVMHPEDIMMVKIIPQDKPKTQPKSAPIHQKTELEQEVERVKQSSSSELRIKKLAELKNMMAEQEKKIIAEKLKDHTIKEVRPIQYDQSGLFKKPLAK